MAQFHHVIYFDTADEKWHVDEATDCYFPDGEVFDYAGSKEWETVPDLETGAYNEQISFVVDQLNSPK